MFKMFLGEVLAVPGNTSAVIFSFLAWHFVFLNLSLPVGMVWCSFDFVEFSNFDFAWENLDIKVSFYFFSSGGVVNIGFSGVVICTTDFCKFLCLK